MTDSDVDKIATKVVDKMNEDRDDHCLFTSVNRHTLHAFAESTTPEAAATLGKVSIAIESMSTKMVTIVVWIVTISALAFFLQLGFEKLIMFAK